MKETITEKDNIVKIIDSVKNVTDMAEKVLAERILFDSNRFIPKDSGDLERSGRVESQNFISWNSCYAKEQYYATSMPRRSVNTNASRRWVEVATKLERENWLKAMISILQKSIKGAN